MNISKTKRVRDEKNNNKGMTILHKPRNVKMI